MFNPKRFKRCHAAGCTATIPIRMLMCLNHWKMVSEPLQEQVYATLSAWEAGASVRPHLIATKRAKVAVLRAEGGDADLIRALEVAIESLEEKEAHVAAR